MLKPNDYDAVTAYGDFKPLPLGGHICKIMKVEETVSSTNKPMLKIHLDIAEQDGEFAGYYAERYRADTRENKRWGCVVNQLIFDGTGNTSRGFKTFLTAVEKSNPNFTVQWGDMFAPSLKNKLVGGVFGREEYIGNDGNSHMSTKCQMFRSVEAIEAGVEVPKDKLLNGGDNAPYFPAAEPTPSSMFPSSYDAAPIMTDDDLPF